MRQKYGKKVPACQLLKQLFLRKQGYSPGARTRIAYRWHLKDISF
jgi:hypothetical protein